MNPSYILKKVYTSEIPQLLPHKCLSETICLCKQIQFDYSIQQSDQNNDQPIQVQAQVQVQDEIERQQKQTHQHQLHNKIKVCSNNPILLYALALFMYGDISRSVYNQIQTGGIWLGGGKCGEGGWGDGVREFLGRLCLRQLLSIKYDWQAMLLLDFINNECENKDIKMIIRLEQDQQHTTVKKQEQPGTFIIAYYPTEQCESLLQTYRFVSQPIDNEIMRRKLQFINLINGTSNNLYGLIEKGCVNCRVVQCGQQGKDQSIENSVITEQSYQSASEKIHKSYQYQSKNSHSQISLSLKFQYFVVFGLSKYVTRFSDRFVLEINNIGYVQFKNNDPFYHAHIFNVIQALANRYSKLKVYSINNGQLIQVYYHTSIKAIFDQVVMNYNQYRTLKLTSSIKSILKQSPFNQLKDKYPDLIISPKDQTQQITGAKQLIQKIQTRQKQKKQKSSSSKAQKSSIKQQQFSSTSKIKNEQIQQFGSPNTIKIDRIQLKSPVKQVDKKSQLEFMSNLQINQHNVADVFVMTDNFKMQEYMSYKIDVGEYVRIVNRVKKCPIVYVVFDGSADLVALLSIIEQDIDLQQINRILHEYQDQLCQKQKQIKTINNETIIKLEPLSEQSDMNEILQKIKKDPQVFVRTLICSLSTLQRILQQCTISFNIIFAVNQPIPNFQMDFCFDKHTYAMRVKINKMHGQYHSLIKCEVANQDYKDAGNLRKQETKLKEMLKKNDHEFEIADFLLSQLDEYNVCYMISQGQKSMFFVLSKRPTQEFIYLTYHQKLLKILRDKKGYFDKLQQASMRDLNKNTEAMLKPVITRAFLTGQKYISINLPFEHIKQVKMEDITFLPTGNSNLISFYTNKINQSERYKVLIKAPYTAEYIHKKFAKHYTLKFENQKLRKQIKVLDLGYGGVKKWRERPFICLRAEWQVCEKVLHKFTVEREAERNQNRRKY